MSPPSFSETAVKRARWLLLLPPCLPGALMLLVGWVRDPRWPASQNVAPLVLARAAFARQQAHVLYTAGSVALLGGVLMAAFIAWKILRPPPPDPEEEIDL